MARNQPKAESEFTLRDKICFYQCKGSFISASDIPALYQGLKESQFSSTYAATNAFEDFAETFAYYFMANYLKASVQIQIPGQTSYDVMEKIKGPKLREKYQAISDLLRSPQYP